MTETAQLEPNTTADVVVTEGVSEEAANTLTQRLSHYLPVSGVSFYERKSFDAQIPQYIQIIGSLPFWTPLAVWATAFVARLAQRAGDDAYDQIKSTVLSKRSNPIEEIATALSESSKKAPANLRIYLGLDTPEPIWGTAVEIADFNPDKIAKQLAFFVIQAPLISEAVMSATEAGCGPFGRGHIIISDNGDIEIKWTSQQDYKAISIVIKYTDKP